ncbi:MAG: pilin [Candidatus Parcubacteria bacterium]|nr:pilin [Candidatus Parcubacteria bacterium]
MKNEMTNEKRAIARRRTGVVPPSGTFGVGAFVVLLLSTGVSVFADSPPKINLAAEPITPNIHSLPEFIQSVLRILLQIGVPVATFFILYSGFLFLTAQGNETKLTSAKNAFLWAVIGTAVLFGSWLLANAIVGTIAQIGGPTG